MGVAQPKAAAPSPNDDEAPRKSRTPEERPVTVCPNCFLALPAATERCYFCE
jgi:hypothetical protein